ncbi:mitochondrial carrier [Westerdykella ornata]|uniref:Mitochondrial carrier n=1 Tax=Westerdykella ornata TaxID=318751 RepID=A0A6A6JQD3_WESOR|nr:mitochondrial carrier [Westerdykella ornata]KAF2278752.1 mitochondrial carrier [Westerdykella ornata]
MDVSACCRGYGDLYLGLSFCRFMDSIMLGSLSVYRRLLNENVFHPRRVGDGRERPKLPTVGHAVAGMMAGWTVSFVAAPVEHIKARLQVQYAAEKSKRLYSGPIDCLRKIVRPSANLSFFFSCLTAPQYKSHGIRGIYHGLLSTLLFRSFFCFWWGTYDLFTRALQSHTSLSAPAINFWAGGLSAQVFWITSYPSDVVKQRIMTDSLGADRRFPRWRDAVRAVYREAGWRGYWRGFVPCFLRAFPANAMALVAFEGVLRALPE